MLVAQLEQQEDVRQQVALSHPRCAARLEYSEYSWRRVHSVSTRHPYSRVLRVPWCRILRSKSVRRQHTGISVTIRSTQRTYHLLYHFCCYYSFLLSSLY
jgi:hypothetical protein